MTRRFRLLLIAAVACAAIISIGPAQGAFSSATKLIVQTQPGLGATGPTTVDLQVAATDDPLARAVIFVPKGYTMTLTAASGTQIGTATATVRAGDLANAVIGLKGATVQARSATGTYTVVGTTIPIAAAAVACTGSAAHTAYWVITISVSGQTIEVPLFVDVATAAESGVAAYTITVCFQPPDVPPNTPNRSPFGLRLLDAKITLNSIFTTPTTAGESLWRAFLTGFIPGTGVANLPGTVEVRSSTIVPVSLSLKGRYDATRGSAVLTGKFIVVGKGAQNVAVPLLKGSSPTKLRKAGKTNKTTKSGAFTATKKILKTTYFQVGGTIGGRLDLDLCKTPDTIAPGGCVSGTRGKLSVFSKVVRVKVPKR
jgi:hypothetical protein